MTNIFSKLTPRNWMGISFLFIGIGFGYGLAKLLGFNEDGVFVSTLTFGLIGFILMIEGFRK